MRTNQILIYCEYTLPTRYNYNGERGGIQALRMPFKEGIGPDLEVKVIFKIQFQATKLSFYTSNKDRVPLFSNSFLVYRFTCPGCSKSYIGKTETTLFVRTRQHGWSDKKSAVYKHFENCPHWNEIVDLLRIDGGDIDTMNLQINTVRDNTEIIRRSDDWLKPAFLESLCIKDYAPELNSGIKS